jgi:HPt (histidine-containing phosphotransfer) domain-containing protein
MLIYNYKKEFLGIDEGDLVALGLTNLADLRAEAADFADLFVKSPGYIHNFKHVHWIDYIIVNNGIDPKVIINVKNKNYVATIDIQTIYLVDNPSQKAYIVNLSHIKALSASQYEKISSDILERPKPKAATGSTQLLTIPSSITHDANAIEEIGKASFDPYESSSDSLNPNIVKDIYESNLPAIDLSLDEEIEIEEVRTDKPELSDIFNEPVKNEVVKEEKTEAISKAEVAGPYANYVFNPKIASEELGLPIDLVEEFIQDFIAQAKSFKKELYNSVKAGELDNVKIQSHKLKGVAANLRVENALDALTMINSSNDPDEIEKTLDKFYEMIDKLSNKNYAEKTDNIQKEEKKEKHYDDDDFIVSIKNHNHDFAQDVTEIEDYQVPDSIDIPELADDEFLKAEISAAHDEISDVDLSILDNTAETTQDAMHEETLDTLLYNRESTANDIGLDIDSFNELFEDYLRESQELLSSIANSVKNNNLGACKSAAIKLKGMSDNMRIHKFDEELETIINSTDVSGVQKNIDGIQSKLNKISNIGNK